MAQAMVSGAPASCWLGFLFQDHDVFVPKAQGSLELFNFLWTTAYGLPTGLRVVGISGTHTCTRLKYIGPSV